MSFINHQSTGAKGLRIAASVIVVLAWLSLFCCCIMALYSLGTEDSSLMPFFCGILSLGALYLLACVVRGFASIVEAAQLYYSLNAPDED